ncbi:integral membrane protein [Xylariales sp. PMI_506]|nr:integral membrane protein [Xylariales sp. PMI_506]
MKSPELSQSYRAPAPRGISTIAHASGLVLFAASFSWLSNHTTNPVHKGFGGAFQFLTFIALALSTATFSVGLLADLWSSRRLSGLKNTFSVCCAPLDILLTLFYWPLHIADKSFVMAPGHDVPFIPDFGFHAVPAIFLTLDVMFLSPSWTVDAYSATALGSLVAFSYWGWVEYCFSRNGR